MLGDEAFALGFVERFEPPAVQRLHAGSMSAGHGSFGASRAVRRSCIMAGMTARPSFLAVVLAATLTACGGTASSPAATEVPEPSTVVTPAPASDAPPSEAP